MPNCGAAIARPKLYLALISCMTLCKSATHPDTKGSSDSKIGVATSYNNGLPKSNKSSNFFIFKCNKKNRFYTTCGKSDYKFHYKTLKLVT